jgi:hypothetical protein
MKRVTLGAALAMLLGALVLAGCGGSSGGDSSASTTTTASSGGGEKGQGVFELSEEEQACLKENGVELPELKGGEGGPPGAGEGEPPEGGVTGGAGQMPEGGELPEGAPPAGAGGAMPEFKAGPGGEGGPNVNSAAFKKQVKEYVACVRENGYELAEPNFSGEGPIFDKSESESSAFKQASAQCSDLLGGPQRSQSG